MSEGGGGVDHEAIVYGAGAAGLSSAAALNQRGVSKLILERSEPPP